MTNEAPGGLVELDLSDQAAISDLLALHHACQAVDQPWNYPQTLRQLTGVLRHGWDGEPGRLWLWYDGDSRGLIGKLRLDVPQRDNRHLVGIDVTIHPEHRRRGNGTRLYEEGVRLARETGRRLLTAETVDADGHNAFAEKLGFQRVSAWIHRRQDLTEVDRAEIESLREQATATAHDYELLRIVGPVPEDMIDQVAVMTAAINDAPTDDMDVEDEVFDAARVRSFEVAQAAWGRTMYRLMARRRSDGALAGHTVVGVDPERPEWADQYDTAVLEEHRGHRLGLLLKAEMLRWLAEAAPDARYVDTGNAETNKHMIGINEQLGYRVVNRGINWQKDL